MEEFVTARLRSQQLANNNKVRLVLPHAVCLCGGDRMEARGHRIKD